jgi:hypothetical protein
MYRELSGLGTPTDPELRSKLRLPSVPLSAKRASSKRLVTRLTTPVDPLSSCKAEGLPQVRELAVIVFRYGRCS